MPRKIMRTIRDVSNDVSRESLSTQPLLTDDYTYGDRGERLENMIDGIPDSADQDIVKDVNQNGIPDDIENEQIKEHTRYQTSQTSQTSDLYDPYECDCGNDINQDDKGDITVTNAFLAAGQTSQDSLSQDRLMDNSIEDNQSIDDLGLEPGDMVEVDIVEIDLVDDSLDDEDYPIDGFMGDEISDEDLVNDDMSANRQNDWSQSANRCLGSSSIDDALVSDGLISDSEAKKDTSMDDMNDRDLINNYRGDQQQRTDAIGAIESEEALNESNLDKEMENDRLVSQTPENKKEGSKDKKDSSGCGCSDW